MKHDILSYFTLEVATSFADVCHYSANDIDMFKQHINRKFNLKSHNYLDKYLIFQETFDTSPLFSKF